MRQDITFRAAVLPGASFCDGDATGSVILTLTALESESEHEGVAQPYYLESSYIGNWKLRDVMIRSII